jgi:hypothetical protein
MTVPRVWFAIRVRSQRNVSKFSKHGDLFGVSIITGPRSVLMRLMLLDERIEDFADTRDWVGSTSASDFLMIKFG